MLKVKVDKFCSLSTSPSWQAWLFHLDAAVYRKFMRRLQESRGCNQNKDLMVELLKEFERMPGAVDKLFEFLSKHYPHMIVKEQQSQPPKIVDKAEPVAVPKLGQGGTIFPYYNPQILTYPRRQVFEGGDLDRRVREFLLDKLKSDFVIVDGKAYVEYLDRSDAQLVNKIPQKNWQIAAWRLKTGF
jgi:hypothetical protein